MSEMKKGMLIDDDEIRQLVPGGDAELAIDKLDRDPATQKYEAMYHGKRNRLNVMGRLKSDGYLK